MKKQKPKSVGAVERERVVLIEEGAVSTLFMIYARDG